VLSDKTDEDSQAQRDRIKKNALVAVENSKLAHSRNKKYYDAGRKVPDFEIGQYVWRFHQVRKKGLTHAFLPQKSGPFIIIDQISPVNFKIKLVNKSNRSKPMIVHVNDIRKVASVL